MPRSAVSGEPGMTLPASSEAVQVTIIVHEDRVTKILDFLFNQQVSGATAYRAFAGFGIHHRMHTAKLLDLATDLPVVVLFIESEDRVRELLPRLAEMAHGGVISTHAAQVYHLMSVKYK